MRSGGEVEALYINTTGLVLRETQYRDSSKILTVLTSSEGKLTVSARGALRRGSRIAAAAQLLAYSHMTLSGRGERWTMTEAQVIELFDGLSRDLCRMALASYFAELLEAVSDEDSPNPGILPLGLNALHLLCREGKDPLLIKAAFEMRLMCLAGFEPDVSGCAACGRLEPETPVLDLAGGAVRCLECAGAAGRTAALCRDSLAALRHIVRSEPKRVFSFRLAGRARDALAEASEGYVLSQLDRRFGALQYFKSLSGETGTVGGER